MYCRNCANEVSEKAVGCPKCGMDPYSEKNFCYECGTATNEKQVLCVQCGVSFSNKAQASHTQSASSLNLSSSDEKTVGIVAYIPIGILNFVIALILHNNNKSKFGAYHLRQSLGLNILFFALYIILFMILLDNPLSAYRYSWVFPLFGITFLAFFIIGIINVSNGQQKPIPLVGNLFEKWFANLFN